MAYPKEGSRAYQILKTLNDLGPQHYEYFAERFPQLTRKSMGALASEYKLPRIGAQFGISATLQKWFAGEAAPVHETTGLGEIPVTHKARPFKPLTGYEAAMRQGRNFREVSFLPSGTSFCNYAD